MRDKIQQEKIFSVGKCYSEWQTKQNGYRLEWSETGFVLYVMLNGINEVEKSQFITQKKVVIRFTVIKDICYFTFMFGEMPWGDCPFSPVLYSQKLIFPNLFPDLENGKGYSLTVLLIDTGIGELCKIRLISLGHDFSVKLRKWLIKATNKPLSFEEYNKQIDEVYLQYANVDLALRGKRDGNEYIIMSE